LDDFCRLNNLNPFIKCRALDGGWGLQNVAALMEAYLNKLALADQWIKATFRSFSIGFSKRPQIFAAR
jgi:hypothetical protein